MKSCILLTLFLALTISASAQHYEVSVASGTSLFRQLDGPTAPLDHMHSRDVEAAVRLYTKGGRWSYGLALNRSEYRFS